MLSWYNCCWHVIGYFSGQQCSVQVWQTRHLWLSGSVRSRHQLVSNQQSESVVRSPLITSPLIAVITSAASIVENMQHGVSTFVCLSVCLCLSHLVSNVTVVTMQAATPLQRRALLTPLLHGIGGVLSWTGPSFKGCQRRSPAVHRRGLLTFRPPVRGPIYVLDYLLVIRANNSTQTANRITENKYV